jgi:hypothetical protein
MGSDGSVPRRSRAIDLAAVLVFVAATAFFAADLSSREVGAMESQDLGHAMALTVPEDQSPIYYVILHFWSELNNTSWAFLRFPSAVAGGAAVACVFLLAKAEAGAVAGVLATLFLALNPFLVWHAREARGYSFLAAFAAASLLFAHRYLRRGRKKRDLAWFVLAAAAGIYTHLFFLPFAGSLVLLFLVDLVWNREGVKRVLVAAVLGGLLIAPQLVRVVAVIGYTTDNLDLAAGSLVHRPIPFLEVVGDAFFLGTAKTAFGPWIPYAPLGIALLILIGMFRRGKSGVVAGVCLIVPTLAVTYHLSATSPVAVRYIIFLLPVAAVFAAIALARARPAYLWAPLAATIATLVVAAEVRAIRAEFPSPPIDWDRAVEYLETERQPGDVVAIFPAHWKHVFRRFYHRDDTISFGNIEEIDRMLASGNRVLLVHTPSKYFNNVERYIREHARVIAKFRTRVRSPLEVFVLEARPPVTVTLTKPDAPSILVTGVIDPGAYPWLLESDPDGPLVRIAEAFGSADLTFTQVAAYNPPPRPRRLWFWEGESVDIGEPYGRIAEYLARAGVRNAFLVPPWSDVSDPAPVLAAAGVRAVFPDAEWGNAAPRAYRVGDVNAVFLYSRQRVYTDRPSFKGTGDAVLADWEKAIARARAALSPGDRLVVLMPDRRDYDRLLGANDQMIARRAIDLGADAVIGVGGGAAKEYEAYRSGVIVYSLGTLLCPREQGRCRLDATGMLLRLTFPRGERVRAETIPVTFDHEYRAAFADAGRFAGLAYQAPGGPAEEHLMDGLIRAKVSCTTREGRIASDFRWREEVRHYESLHEGYARSGARAAVGGINSSGEFRRALVLQGEKVRTVSAVFDPVTLGEELRVVYGVPDYAIGRLGRRSERLTIVVGTKTVLNRRIEFLTGWKTESIDTSHWTGTAQAVAITLEADGSDFPVAVDPVVVRGPKTIAAMEAGPYRFDEHLGEARVLAIKAGGPATRCLGPDESFRYLRGGGKKPEENGPNGEGVLYRRWYCGDLPWNATALTIQKSGSELRPAIWHHPLDGATRLLTFGPLPIPSEIQGYYGFTDLAGRKTDVPVEFVVRVGNQEVFRQSVTNERGWRPLAVAIPETLRGKNLEVSFVVRAAKDKWRHFCFNAWMQ